MQGRGALCRALGIYILNSRRPKVNTKIEERIREYIGDDPDKLLLFLAQAIRMAGEHGYEEELARVMIAHGVSVATLAQYYDNRATETVDHDIETAEQGDKEESENCDPVGCNAD